MVVVIGWAVAGFVALLTFAALALGLRGHLARFRRAADAAQRSLTPTLRTVGARLPHPGRISGIGRSDSSPGFRS